LVRENSSNQWAKMQATDQKAVGCVVFIQRPEGWPCVLPKWTGV